MDVRAERRRAARRAVKSLDEWVDRLHLPTLTVTAVAVVAWSLLSWRYGAYVLPSPRAVVGGLADILRTGEVWTHTGASLSRILIGFGGAVGLALLMGLASFLSRRARAVVHDVLAVLNSTSVFVWIVLSIIWFGLSRWAPIFTTLMITLPVVASNIVEGVEILATQMVFAWALVMVLVMMVTAKLVFDSISRRLSRWR